MRGPAPAATRDPLTRSAPAALLACALLAGCGGGEPATSAEPSSSPARAVLASDERPSAAAAKSVRPRAAARPPRPGRPVSIAIPAIGVSARIVGLGVDRAGRLEAPADPAQVGWWAAGPRPGAPGAAVLAGHLDDRDGPAVFARLRTLRRGSRIVVADRLGHRHVFAVQRVASYPKADFPTSRVYRTVRGPALRLITCGGKFDRAGGHYENNVVVYAVPDQPSGRSRSAGVDPQGRTAVSVDP